MKLAAYALVGLVIVVGLAIGFVYAQDSPASDSDEAYDYQDNTQMRIKYIDVEQTPWLKDNRRVNLTSEDVNASQPLQRVLGVGADLGHDEGRTLHFPSDEMNTLGSHLWELETRVHPSGTGGWFHWDGRHYSLTYIAKEMPEIQ